MELLYPGKNTLEIELFDFSNLRVRIWASTIRPSKFNSGQNYFSCSKAHIIISYSMFDFNVFRVWPLTSESHLGLKNITFESQYMISCLTSMDTISLSCTVFELFHFKVFRVRPLPLTSKDHLGSNICIVRVLGW